MERWVTPRLKQAKNLRVLLRTVVVNSARDSEGRLTELTAVQRTPTPDAAEWSQRLSDELPDWYSPASSPSFSKQLMTIRAKVFIEGTELGDVLATSGSKLAQGIEFPFENSTAFEHCGQSQALTFYMELLAKGTAPPPPSPSRQPPPHGNNEGRAFDGKYTETSTN